MSNEAQELSLDELHSVTSEELVKEVNEANRVHAGVYLARTASYKAIRRPMDDLYNPNRAEAQLTVELFDPADPTQRKGRVSFVTMSWESRPTPWGGPDQMSKDWVAFLRALQGSATDTPGTTLELSKNVFYQVTVELKVNSPADALHPEHVEKLREGKEKAYVTITSEEQYEHYIAEGLEPKAKITRFSVVK